MQDIKIKNLNYTYPEKETPALKNINLEIKQGEFVLLVGGSGSGKSTFMRSIAGLVPSFYGGTYSGKIYLGKQEICQLDRRSLVQKVGMVFQDPESQLVMTNVEEEIVFGLENLALDNKVMKRRVMEVTNALALTQYANHFIPELSGGQKQKTVLASILAMQPEIILLDEPTSQLDPIAGEDILTMLRRLNEENGITVILIEQRLERCFHLADRILVMENGEIKFEHYSTDEIAKWAVKNNKPFIPPLAKLFSLANYENIPVTVKQGREILLTNKNDLYGTKAVTEQILIENKNIENNDIAKLENLWFTYPNGKEVLKDINLEIQSQQINVIMGGNGSGKTTLLKQINGLLKPSRGKVIIDGQNTNKKSIEELASTIGYLSQNPNDYLFLPSVEEEIAFTMKNLKIKENNKLEQILEKLNIQQLREKNPRDLSVGERQRIAIATILVSNLKILMLDEPTRGLDYELKESLGELLTQIKKEGTTILIVTHDVEFAAEYADNIILIDKGTVIGNGNKYEMLTNSTFYSPQVSKLFHNISENIVTIKQGEKILKKLKCENEGYKNDEKN